MSRCTSALAIALLAVAITTQQGLGQQAAPKAPSTASENALPNPMAAARSARTLLRNGLDYLSYQEFERALDFLREAESRKQELMPDEQKALKVAIDRAQLGMRELADSPRPVYAKSRVGQSAPGAIATAQPSRKPVQLSAPEPVQLTAGEASVRIGQGGTREPADQPPAIPSSLPGQPSLTQPSSATAEPNMSAVLPQQVPAIDPAGTEPGSGGNAPASTPAPGQLMNLPALGGEAMNPASPPAPLPVDPRPEEIPQAGPAEVQRSPAEVTPSESAEFPPSPIPVPAVESSRGRPEGNPATGTPARPTTARTETIARQLSPPASDTASWVRRSPSTAEMRRDAGQPGFLMAQVEPVPSRLTPDLRREVEEVAHAQDEAARRKAAEPQPEVPPGSLTEGEQPTARLELPRAPSPTEARPLRAIPVPEEFVPLSPRQWNPTRKYWAAAATCHAPLYFQDASLERYGHSVEQFFGPTGRYLTYPIDDPTQSNQRNQIIQPFFSAGLYAMQIVLLPINMLLDAPWEAEYDLGYWRPGDRVPPDVYYLPCTGVGPPLHGSNY